MGTELYLFGLGGEVVFGCLAACFSVCCFGFYCRIFGYQLNFELCRVVV